MKPIVKWAGGKRRLLPELLQRVPAELRTFIEPFAGGAALFFALATEVAAKKRRIDRVVLADENAELVACYRAVQKDVRGVIAALRKYRYDKDLFYETRDKETAGMPVVERAARLLFLNRTCFNGLWRVNASGRFNVPFGTYKNPRILDEEGLLAASLALANAEILRGDFTEATCGAGAGDFVYFDPPYTPLTKTAAFTSYAVGGFSQADHARLLAELRALKKRGALAMLSNADTPEMRDLYADFAVNVVTAPRTINADGAKRGDASELLVTTWDPPGVRAARKRAASGEGGLRSVR